MKAAHLLRQVDGWVLQEANVLFEQDPSGVEQIGVGPHHERIAWRQMIRMTAARWKAVDAYAGRSKHGQRPWRQRRRSTTRVADAVYHLHLTPARSHPQLDPFLKAGQLLYRSSRLDRICTDRDRDRGIVQRVGPYRMLGRGP